MSALKFAVIVLLEFIWRKRGLIASCPEGTPPVHWENSKSVLGMARTVTFSFSSWLYIPGTGAVVPPAPGLYNQEENENVTILAIPNTDFKFSQWTGSVPSGQETNNPLFLQMNSSKTITANFRAIIYAPLQFEGQRVENRSLSQRESIIVLNWQAHPNNSNITLYRLYGISGLDWNKLADVDSSVFTYQHRRVELNQTYSYVLVAVSSAGSEGAPTYLTINNE